MSQPIVKKIELFAIGPNGKKISWSSFLGPMNEAMIVTRLTFDTGLQGIAGLTTYTEHEFDQTAFQSAVLMSPFLLGRHLGEIAEIHQDMQAKYIPLKHLSCSLFDIALHDAKAKSLGLPIYKMLGAEQEKIRAYASSPVFDSIEAYLEYCHDMLAQGFNAIKIHPPCVYETDRTLVEALQAEFSERKIGWSLDVDANYSLEQALNMGQLLDEYEWEFFEEPLPDANLAGYQELVSKLKLDVISGGNSLPQPLLIDYGLQRGCWDRSRFDVTSIGGFTSATQVMASTKAHACLAEVQSWGYTLTQAANLHLMLAHKECYYFEQAAPYEKYEFAAKQVFRPDAEGYIQAPTKPGLGIDLDWEQLAPYVYQSREFTL